MVTSIKQGDKFPVTFTVNHDLTGTATRLIVRHGTRTGPFEELEHATAGSTATHTLDGTWEPGRHFIELEITNADEVRTAPSADFLEIRILRDLDQH